jgi:hypothetical protein
MDHHRTRLEPLGELDRAAGLGEALGEGVMDAVLRPTRRKLG